MHTPTSTCESSQLDARTCSFIEFPMYDAAAQAAVLAEGMTPHPRVVARYGYLPTVRYLLEWLPRAADIECKTLPDERALIVSAGLRFGVVIEVATGRVDQVRRCDIPGRTDITNYIGALAGLPFHHPERAITWKLEGDHVADASTAPPGESAIGISAGLEVFTVAPLPSRVDDSLFSWHSVAKQAVDQQGRITKADGTVLASRAKKSVPIASSDSTGSSGPNRMLLSAGIASIVLAAVGFVRRHIGLSH